MDPWSKRYSMALGMVRRVEFKPGRRANLMSSAGGRDLIKTGDRPGWVPADRPQLE